MGEHEQVMAEELKKIACIGRRKEIWSIA